MGSLFKKIKKNAKHALQNNWSKAIAIMFIMAMLWAVLAVSEAIISNIAGVSGYIDKLGTASIFFDDKPDISLPAIIISAVFSVLGFMMFFPLSAGICRWNLNVAAGEQNDVSDIFLCFRSIKIYIKSILLGLSLLWRYMLWALLFFALPFFVQIFGIKLLQGAESALFSVLSSIMVLISVLMWVICFILFAIFIQKYSMVKYILVLDAQQPVSHIIKLSCQAVHGNRLKLTLFKLSFLLHYFIGIILLLPMLYVIPFFNASTAIYAKLLLEKHKIQLANEPFLKHHDELFINTGDNSQPESEMQ
mgnify:CR=1 FL=1